MYAYVNDNLLDITCVFFLIFFFFQAEDGIRDLVRSRGLGDVYKRQAEYKTKKIPQMIYSVLVLSPTKLLPT